MTGIGVEKYLKKLIRNTDIEDSLEKLDKLTQEEAQMASAEQLRITHSVEGKVMVVDERVQIIGDDMQDVGKKVEDVNNKVQGIDDGMKDVRDEVQGVHRKLDDANRSSSPIAHAPIPNFERSGLFTGNLLHDNLLRWLLPSNPSINHNIASKAHHDSMAQWFFQGHIFNQWKSAASFLWVHGKHVFLLISLCDINLNHLDSIAGAGKSILWFVLHLLVQPY